MVFSSLLFAFFFFPLIVGIYYLSKEEYRNYILLIASLLFYSYGEPKFVFVMLLSILVNYLLAIAISQADNHETLRKWILIIDIIINVGVLFTYKYLDFSILMANRIFNINIRTREIALPIGISFFTFQALSYVIDVFRRRVDAQKNVFYLALYISFFPQLIAGPIVRYSSINEQIEYRECSSEKFTYGFKRFLIGFSKKVLLANNLAVVSREVFELELEKSNPLVLWLGAICFSLQIYYDFSGYSDMAIGLGRIFGFEFEENFNYPYISKSITEFWRRWHISLGQWFRDYVYIPLGGSRVGYVRMVFNLFVVWLLTGVWHGANYTFIAWGLWYFCLLLLEKLIIKPEKNKSFIIRCVWQIITLLAINFGWVIFNSASISGGIKFCKAMVGCYAGKMTIDSTVIRYFREYGWYILLGIILATPLREKLDNYFDKTKFKNVYEVGQAIMYGLLFLWSVSFILLGAHNPFIYFNF